VVADFSTLATIQDYKEVVGEAVRDLDIAMLFLNAGWASIGPFAEISHKDV